MLSVRQLTASDIPFGMELKTEASWNQLASEWERAWALDPNGCFVGLCDGTPAATLTTCTFGRTAWIAMVLTRSTFRGRGLATALLKHSIAYLHERGVESIRLDATALGRPVYEKLGFQVDSEITRFYGRPTLTPSTVDAKLRLVPLAVSHLAACAELDAAATGNDRTSLLQRLHQEWPTAGIAALRGDEVQGFCLARRGSRAAQIGPCIVAAPHDGAAVLAAGMQRLGEGPLYLDVPHRNPAGRRFAGEVGLAAERDFFRMTLGRPVAEQSERIWANYGPEKG